MTKQTHAILRRLRIIRGDSAEYCIMGVYIERDSVAEVEIDMGVVTSAWWEVPLPPCPDCGGDLVWWEAGYVPGTRRCMGAPVAQVEGRPAYDQDGGCGSLFIVDTIATEGV